jgi:hypothetical protein
MRRISQKTAETRVPLKENKISAFRMFCELSIIGGFTDRHYHSLMLISIMAEREKVFVPENTVVC